MRNVPIPLRVLVVDLRPLVIRALSELVNSQRPRMEVVGHASCYLVTLQLAHRVRPNVILFSMFPDALDPLQVISLLARRCDAGVLIFKSLYDDVSVPKAIAAGAHGAVLSEGAPELILDAISEVHAARTSERRPAPTGFPVPIAVRSGRDQVKLEQLTAREKEVIRAIASYPSAKYLSIAERLGISEHTVHNHLSRIYQKLDLSNRIELLMYSSRHGLLEGAEPEARERLLTRRVPQRSLEPRGVSPESRVLP
jgi:DNA-binding NarL/FixJ family response regulator